MRKRSQAYHAKTQEEFSKLMQDDEDNNQSNSKQLIPSRSLFACDKPGIIDSIQWLEQPDFEEKNGKYKLELFSTQQTKYNIQPAARIKCLVIAEDLEQLQNCLSVSRFPHLSEQQYQQLSYPKILELAYSSPEEEIWIHYRTFQPAASTKEILYLNIIEECFYPKADLVILFTDQQLDNFLHLRGQSPHIFKQSQKVYIYDQIQHIFSLAGFQSEETKNKCTSERPTLSSMVSSLDMIKSLINQA